MTDRTVVLVEDNANDEALTMRALKRSDIAVRVLVLRDGVEALEWVFARGSYSDRDLTMQPQLMLLDLNLPKLGGLEVLKAVRAHPSTRRLPVVLLTSSSDEQDLVKGYELGANSFIRKPVRIPEFAAVVEKLGLYWLAVNEVGSASGKGEAE